MSYAINEQLNRLYIDLLILEGVQVKLKNTTSCVVWGPGVY